MKKLVKSGVQDIYLIDIKFEKDQEFEKAGKGNCWKNLRNSNLRNWVTKGWCCNSLRGEGLEKVDIMKTSTLWCEIPQLSGVQETAQRANRQYLDR